MFRGLFWCLVLISLWAMGPPMGMAASAPVGASAENGGEVLLDEAASLQSALRQGTTALVYRVGDAATLACVVTDAGVQGVVRIEISRDELADKVTALREHLYAHPTAQHNLVERLNFLVAAQDMYELLVAPVAEYFEGTEHLVIVPSDVLFMLPFAALYDCPGCEGRYLIGGEYLVERYVLSYAPSISVLQDIDPHIGSVGRSLVVLSPVYDLHHYSEVEARAVADLLPGSTLLAEVELTVAAVRAHLEGRRHDIVHLVAPWTLDLQCPMNASIRLQWDETDDSALRFGELLDWEVSIGLIVLSGDRIDVVERANAGCAIGEWAEGLHTAGVDAVVLSVASALGDTATMHLMVELCRGLVEEGLNAAEALRQAQLALIRDGTGLYGHPFHWSGFVLYGNWRGGEGVARLPETGKLDASLHAQLQAWKEDPGPVEEAPVCEVLVTLNDAATDDDLQAIRDVSDRVEVEGSFGVFVLVRVPLPFLEALSALPQVRTIAVRPETLLNLGIDSVGGGGG